ncbi:MAG: hypothetical protein WBM13_13750 [Bacteroidia bacterium]
MAVYRFRVTFEDNEEVYREIDIKSTQTYEDFNNAILESLNFDKIHNASFFISDDMWRKGEEIVLRQLENNDNNNRRNKEAPKRLMSKCKMALLIDDPHQKFVYIYDHKAHWTFTVELIKILADDDKKNYPLCSKTVGEAPKQYIKTNVVPVAVDDDEDFDEDDDHADDEAYASAEVGTDDDDIAELEGEEGEEELVEGEDEEVHEEDDEYGFSEFENGGLDNGDD